MGDPEAPTCHRQTGPGLRCFDIELGDGRQEVMAEVLAHEPTASYSCRSFPETDESRFLLIYPANDWDAVPSFSFNAGSWAESCRLGELQTRSRPGARGTES